MSLGGRDEMTKCRKGSVELVVKGGLAHTSLNCGRTRVIYSPERLNGSPTILKGSKSLSPRFHFTGCSDATPSNLTLWLRCSWSSHFVFTLHGSALPYSQKCWGLQFSRISRIFACLKFYPLNFCSSAFIKIVVWKIQLIYTVSW